MARKKKKGLSAADETIVKTPIEKLVADSITDEDVTTEVKETKEPVEEVSEDDMAIAEEVTDAPVKKAAEKRARKTATTVKIKALLGNNTRPIQSENGTATITNVELIQEAVTIVDFVDGTRDIIGNSAVVKTNEGEMQADQLEASNTLGGKAIANVDVTTSIQLVVVPTTTKGNFASANGTVIVSGGLMRKTLINLY